MAKQYGIHKIGGKVDGQSYYYSKNGGFVSRKINPGMSARVKEGKEYANTRLNNAEFGAAGSLAGAMVGTVSQRWRYILDSVATGKLVKVIKAAMMQDVNNEWGQRTVPLDEMAGIQDAYNRFSKNDMPQSIKSLLQDRMTVNTATNTLIATDGATLSNDEIEVLRDKGVTHVTTKVFGLNITVPEFSSVGNKYEPINELLVDISTTFGKTHLILSEENEVISDSTLANSPKLFNEDSHLGGVLVVFLPEREVGGKYYTMQELCSAFYYPAKEIGE